MAGFSLPTYSKVPLDDVVQKEENTFYTTTSNTYQVIGRTLFYLNKRLNELFCYANMDAIQAERPIPSVIITFLRTCREWQSQLQLPNNVARMCGDEDSILEMGSTPEEAPDYYGLFSDYLWWIYHFSCLQFNSLDNEVGQLKAVPTILPFTTNKRKISVQNARKVWKFEGATHLHVHAFRKRGNIIVHSECFLIPLDKLEIVDLSGHSWDVHDIFTTMYYWMRKEKVKYQRLRYLKQLLRWALNSLEKSTDYVTSWMNYGMAKPVVEYFNKDLHPNVFISTCFQLNIGDD